MPLQIRVDPARCIGSKVCVHAAPSVFRLDDTGVAQVVDAGGDPDPAVVAAAEGCPTGAIEVVQDGRRIV